MENNRWFVRLPEHNDWLYLAVYSLDTSFYGNTSTLPSAY